MRFLAYTRGSTTSIIPYSGALLENVARINPISRVAKYSYEDVEKLVRASGGFIKRADGQCFSNVAVSGCPTYYLMKAFSAVVYNSNAINFVVEDESLRRNFDFAALSPKAYFCSYASHIFNSEASSYAYVYGGILQTFEVADTAFNAAMADCLIYNGYKLVGMVNPHESYIPWIKLPDNRKMAEVVTKYLFGWTDGSGALSQMSPSAMFHVQGGQYALMKTDVISKKVKEISVEIFENAEAKELPDFGPCTKFLGIQPTKDIYEGKMVAAVTHSKDLTGDVLAYVFDGGIEDKCLNDLRTPEACVHYAILDCDLNTFFARLDALIQEADEQFFKDYSSLLRSKIGAMGPQIDEYFGQMLTEKVGAALGIPVQTEGAHIQMNLPQGELKTDVDAMLQMTAFDYDSKNHIPAFGPKFKQAVADMAQKVSDDSLVAKGYYDGWLGTAYPMTKEYALAGGGGVNVITPGQCEGSYPLAKLFGGKNQMVTLRSAAIIADPVTAQNTLRLNLNVAYAYQQAWKEMSGEDISRKGAVKVVDCLMDAFRENGYNVSGMVTNYAGAETCDWHKQFGWVNTSYKKTKNRQCGVVAGWILTAGISAACGSLTTFTRYGEYAAGDADYDPVSYYNAYIDIPLPTRNVWTATVKNDVYELYKDYRLDTIAMKICPLIEDLLGDIKDAAVDRYFCLVEGSMVYSFFTGLLHSKMYLTYNTLLTIVQKFEVYKARGILTDDVVNFLGRLVSDIEEQYKNTDLQTAIDTKIYGLESFDGCSKVSGDAESFALYNFMEE